MTGGRTFVIVASDPVRRVELRRLLNLAFGSHVDVREADGPAVVDLPANAAPACVLVVHEPDTLDSIELLADWHSRRLLQRRAVVVITEQREVRRAALRAGAAAHLDPSSLTEARLREAIEDAVDRSIALSRDSALDVWSSEEPLAALWRRIEARMGACPSFFRQGRHAPPVARTLFVLAELAYLDNPLPPIFKETMFVYLSRFCPIPYCLARHCAMLLEQLRRAGDGELDIATARALLDEPLPSGEELEIWLTELEQMPPLDQHEWPSSGSRLDHHLRIAAAQVFLHSHHAGRWLCALERVLGKAQNEQLLLFSSFVRTAHFWTEVHPNLEFDPDLEELLLEHEALAASLAAASCDALRGTGTELRLRAEIVDLRARIDTDMQIRRLADALPVFISYVDTTQRFVFVNQNYARQFERPVDELRGLSVIEVLGAESFAGVRPQLEAALRGEHVHSEQCITLPSGERRHVQATYVPDVRADGAVVGCFALVLDVTERTLAESLTRRVLDNLFAFVGILELDGTLLEVNVAPLAAAGLKIADVRGKRFWDCFWWSHSPESQARVRDACERAARGETVRYDVEIRIAGGRMIIDFQLAPLCDGDGRITHLVPSAVDITERKRVEQILRESEERLRMAQDAAGLGIHDFDVQTRAIRWDARVREMWGVGPDQTITFELFMDGIHPDDRALVQAAVDHAIDPEGDGVYLVEYRVRNRVDGRIRWAAVTGQTTFENGEALRMVGTVQDISARKHAETVLRESQEQLRESDRRKDEFLAMLGHELRNPLAAIHNAAELLRQAHVHDSQLARIRAVLDRQIHHMIRLIDGLLEVSRIARGKIHLECSNIDLREVLEAVIGGRSEQLCDGLQLELQLSDQPLWVWADEVRIAQIFDNLLGNAIKFSTVPGRIRVVASRDNQSIVVQVSDTGVGIRPEMLEAVFEPFQQDAQSLARSAGGLGLGLALVRELVELHHGQVVARSEGSGRGAEFEVRLPTRSPWCNPSRHLAWSFRRGLCRRKLAVSRYSFVSASRPRRKSRREEPRWIAPRAPSAAPSPSLEPAPSSTEVPRRVLIIEDNTDVALMMADLLTLLGHEVAVAQNGPQGLAQLTSRAFDVVFCDIGLPQMNGYDIARAIRAEPSSSGVMLVALTGYGQPEDRRRTAQAGFDAHLVKPVDLQVLQDVLERVDRAAIEPASATMTAPSTSRASTR